MSETEPEKRRTKWGNPIGVGCMLVLVMIIFAGCVLPVVWETVPW